MWNLYHDLRQAVTTVLCTSIVFKALVVIITHLL
jgi:hypothetical protein